MPSLTYIMPACTCTPNVRCAMRFLLLSTGYYLDTATPRHPSSLPYICTHAQALDRILYLCTSTSTSIVLDSALDTLLLVAVHIAATRHLH